MKTLELAKELNISVQMCNRLKRRGMPSDSLQSAIEWRKQNLDITQTKNWRIDGNQGKKTVSTEDVEVSSSMAELLHKVTDTQLNLDGSDADVLLRNARALKEKSLALQAEAERQKFIGELVLKEHVEKIVFERSRSFRDGLLALSRRLAPELVGKDDISAIESKLNSEFRQILFDFAKLPVIEQ